MNTIKIRLNKRLGDFPKGKILDAELKTHGIVTLDNNGASRILEAGEFTVYDIPKGVRIGLRKARELAGLKVMDVGNAIERSRTSMNGYENGDREVQEETKEAYAKVLNMKVEWLEWNVDINKAYYNDMVMKKIKSSMQQVDEVAETDKAQEEYSIESIYKQVDDMEKELKNKINGMNLEISTMYYEMNKIEGRKESFYEQQIEYYRSLDNKIFRLEEFLDEHSEIYNKNNADIFKQLDVLVESYRKMNERMKKFEEYIIDIETKLSEYEDILNDYNYLPWYKRLFSKIDVKRGMGNE